jgi:hypothetical protein
MSTEAGETTPEGTPDLSAESAKPDRKGNLHRDVSIAVLSGVIALVTALVVALISVQNANSNLSKDLNASQRAQTNEFMESRQAEARGRNAAIYQEVLAAADASFRNDRMIRVCLLLFRPDFRQVVEECLKRYDPDPTRGRYQKAINVLYLYGSDNAWKAQENLTKSLVTGRPEFYRYDVTREVVARANWQIEGLFPPAYAALQQIMCRELSTQAVARCEHAPPNGL